MNLAYQFNSYDIIVNEYIEDGTFYKNGNKIIIGDSSYYPLIFASGGTIEEKTKICITYAKEKIEKFIKNYKID